MMGMYSETKKMEMRVSPPTNCLAVDWDLKWQPMFIKRIDDFIININNNTVFCSIRFYKV